MPHDNQHRCDLVFFLFFLRFFVFSTHFFCLFPGGELWRLRWILEIKVLSILGANSGGSSEERNLKDD